MSKYSVSGATLALAMVAMAASAPADAQKSKDTLRANSLEPISIVDRIFNPQPATTLMTSAIFDSLVQFDAETRKYHPSLAKSWKLVDDQTVEFELKEGIKFHDGSTVDADDILAVMKVVTDPKVKFRFKESRYGFFEGAEKLGPNKVRIKFKGPYATWLVRMGANFLVYPSERFLKDMQDFGKAPVGTGPYRVTQVDSNSGVIMKKHEGFQLEGPGRPAAKIGTVQIRAVGDMQTQQAQMMVGELDFMFAVQRDQAESMAQHPDFKLSVSDVPSYSYLQFDAADRSGIGMLKDQRVRKAISHAIDREALKTALLPAAAKDIPLPAGMCHPWLIACKYSAELPEYDPALAKKLLAEAGYPNGFDLTLTTWGAVKDVGVALAGYLRAVGIRANSEHVTYGVYAKKRGDGQLQALVSYYDNAGAQPDAEFTMNFFYLPGERDYMRDESLHAITKASASMMDLNERTAAYQKIMDTVIEKNYLMPLLPVPAIVVHHKDLVLEEGHKSPDGFYYNYMRWAN